MKNKNTTVAELQEALNKRLYEYGGSGKRIKPAIVKKYTPEHEAKLAEKAHARFLKKQAEANAAFLRNNGFGEDGTG